MSSGGFTYPEHLIQDARRYFIYGDPWRYVVGEHYPRVDVDSFCGWLSSSIPITSPTYPADSPYQNTFNFLHTVTMQGPVAYTPEVLERIGALREDLTTFLRTARCGPPSVEWRRVLRSDLQDMAAAIGFNLWVDDAWPIATEVDGPIVGPVPVVGWCDERGWLDRKLFLAWLTADCAEVPSIPYWDWPRQSPLCRVHFLEVVRTKGVSGHEPRLALECTDLARFIRSDSGRGQGGASNASLVNMAVDLASVLGATLV